MAQLLGLSAEQVDGIRPLFPKERGVERVNDRKVLSGIIHVIQKGLNWVDAPRSWIDATGLKACPPACSLNKGGPPDQRAKGGVTSKLPMACDSKGGSLWLHLRRGNAVTSLVLMGRQKTCRLLLW